MSPSPLAWALALIACGRLGFEAAAPGDGGPGIGTGDGGAPGTTITVIVTSDEYLDEPAGEPVPDATVLVDRGGAVERLATDADGTVEFPAAGVTAYHVAYERTIGWRVYTGASPRPGTIELGGRAAFNLNRSMTVTVPQGGSGSGSGSGSATFTARLPDRCAELQEFSSPTFSFDFNPACDGAQVRMVAFRLDGSTVQYIDAGTVRLAGGSTHAVTGAYQTAPMRTIQLAGVPHGTATTTAAVVMRTGVDLVRLSGYAVGNVSQLGSGSVATIPAAHGGDALLVRAFSNATLLSSSEQVAPVVIADQTALDARSMLPLFTSLEVNRLPVLSWTGGAGGALIVVEATTGDLQWNVLADPATTSVTFPTLPADLGVVAPARFDVISVSRFDVPGATAADLVRTMDRTWKDWPYSAALVTPTGGSMARILFIDALTDI